MPEVQAVEVAEAGARILPAVVVSTLDITSTALSCSVYALTFVYLLFQIVVIFPKVQKVLKNIFRKGGKRDRRKSS